MVAHAFFKGLLFLGAGSVIHGLHDAQDLKRMGNLRRYMKLTTWTFGVGWLAIAGIPPLSGFWAKGDILTNAFARYPALYAIGLFTALLTAYYMSRLMALAFYGDDRWHELFVRPEAHRETASGSHWEMTTSSKETTGSAPHEGPRVMRFPLVVLSVLAFFGGVLSLPWHPKWDPLRWLGPVFGSNLYQPVQSLGEKWALSIVDAVVALAGLAIALPLWSRSPDHGALEPTALRRALYMDDIYDTLLGRPSEAFARFAAVVIDNKVIDGAVNGVGRLVRSSGGVLRKMQTGFVRQYALAMAVGAVVLLAWMASRALS